LNTGNNTAIKLFYWHVHTAPIEQRHESQIKHIAKPARQEKLSKHSSVSAIHLLKVVFSSHLLGYSINSLSDHVGQ